MPCSASSAASDERLRLARMPPWIFGWSVLTRPSRISGKPVTAETAITGTPASSSAVAVPPVDTISTPSRPSPAANSASPCLSETDTRARRTGNIAGSSRPGPSRASAAGLGARQAALEPRQAQRLGPAHRQPGADVAAAGAEPDIAEDETDVRDRVTERQRGDPEGGRAVVEAADPGCQPIRRYSRPIDG